MSYQESKSLTNIISTIIITGVYAIIVYQRYINGVVDTTDVFNFWAVTILIFIPISIAARIIIMVFFSVGTSVVQTAKGEEAGEMEIVDERDKLIELKAARISLIIFSAGFVIALITQAMKMNDHIFFIVLIIFGVITEIVSELTAIYHYRTGV